jgi:hypothetical protein
VKRAANAERDMASSVASEATRQSRAGSLYEGHRGVRDRVQAVVLAYESSVVDPGGTSSE